MSKQRTRHTLSLTPFASTQDPRDPSRRGGTQVLERTKVKKPKMYKVLLHNDHYTTMEFVVWILESVFRRNEAEATEIMLHIHQNGVGVAGIYSKEVAETKAEKTLTLAQKNNFPLQCTYEEA
ncbi:MAG: ATP-dependent Clp protease adaptor ClpS [Myxococcota bacterium]|nr:ATP-dependent Clp protease adaptor ClpS [Myxococcota bacterium]